MQHLNVSTFGCKPLNVLQKNYEFLVKIDTKKQRRRFII